MSIWSSPGRRCAGGLTGLLSLVICASAVAQQAAPVRRELGIIGLTTLGDPAFGGGGLYAAIRPGGNTRVAVTATVGGQAGELSGRGELLGHFVLNPRRMRGLGVYGLAGLAAEVRTGTRGYLVMGLGLETASGRRSGWALEAGVGGGVRLAVGWRRRW